MKRTGSRWIVLFIITGLCVFGASRLYPEEKILARVGDRTVTQFELDEYMKRTEYIRKGNPYGVEEKKEIINMLVKNSLLGIEAEREKLDQSPEFQSRLKMYKNELLTKEYISQKIEPLVTVKNEEIEEILKQNPNLIPKERLTLKEILVKTEKEAEEIYQELKKGADFSKMAAEKSIAQTKTKEGLIGTISRGQLPPPIEAVVFGLKEGEFSRPIKMEQGFEILYLVSRKEMDPEQRKVLEGKLREKITQMEKTRKMGPMIDMKIEELKKQIKVETYFDQLK